MEVSEKAFHDKPGIGTLSSLSYDKKKAIIASGGFDHRIKVTSIKTMKELIILKFHQNIVNQVILEKAGDGQAMHNPLYTGSTP
jgi:hypothetical protein